MMKFIAIILFFLIGCQSITTDSKRHKYITSPWETEPRGQEYTLNHGDWIFYWKSDEKPVKAGMVYILWGYYRIIAHEKGFTEFRDVEWCNANP